MRMLVKFSMPTDVFNEYVRDGTAASMLEKLVGALQPEAAYFVAMEGVRTALVVADVKEPSEMVKAAEPFFLAMEAGVEFYPAMTAEDLKKAAPYFDIALKEFPG
ncbi:MAG: hypothetical protein M1274_07730 [Actinobacteria bacterium]|nr:hypothetical protein [Actinomycetota bacterium]